MRAYRCIPGRAYRADDDPEVVGRALRELHGIGLNRAAAALGTAPSLDAWAESYRRLADGIRTDVLPLLPQPSRDALEVALSDLAREWGSVTPSLVHRDLGAEHLLMRDSHDLSGIIDFGDATIGDPTINFVGVRSTSGLAGVRRATAAYGAEVDLDRLQMYYWLGAAHAVRYGVRTRDDRLVRDATAGLAPRLLRPAG